MSKQKIALVTGANKGIWYEIAAGLGTLGWRIGVGARDQQRPDTAVDKLRAAGADAFGVPLDVIDDASVAAAASPPPTDLNGFQGVRTPEQGAAIAVRLATLSGDGPTSGFFDDAGPVCW